VPRKPDAEPASSEENNHDVCFGASLHRSTLDKYLDIVHGGQEVERTERSKMTLP
jgi:hypothetical protein